MGEARRRALRAASGDGNGAARGCGECGLCCTLLAVEELGKPADAPCAHCLERSGCAVYAGRPASCRDFDCYWLEHPALPAALRPDRSHVLVWLLGEPPKTYLMLAEPGHAAAVWQPAVARLRRELLGAGWNVAVGTGTRAMLYSPDGGCRPMILD